MNERKRSNFHCSSGSNKEFAPIVYDTNIVPMPPGFSGHSGSVHVVVPTITGKTDLKCTVLIAMPRPYVSSERAAMTISFGTAVVTRSFDQNLIPGFLHLSLTTRTTNQRSLMRKPAQTNYNHCRR
jgi:hypothetical protein